LNRTFQYQSPLLHVPSYCYYSTTNIIHDDSNDTYGASYDITSLSTLSNKAYELSIDELEKVVEYLESKMNKYLESKLNNDDGQKQQKDYYGIKNQNYLLHNVADYQNTNKFDSEEIKHVHKLMASSSQFGTLKGAEITERFLALVVMNDSHEHEHDNYSQADSDGDKNIHHHRQRNIVYDGPTSKMYTIAMNAWSNIQEKSNDSSLSVNNDNISNNHNVIAAQHIVDILNFMWEEYHKSTEITTSLEKRNSTKKIPQHFIKPDVMHYTIALHAIAKTRSKKEYHKALSLLDDIEHKSGVHSLLKGELHGNYDDDNDKRQNLGDVDPNLVPDRTCYNSILYILSQYNNAINDINIKDEIRYYSAKEVLYMMNSIIRKMDLLSKVLKDDQSHCCWSPNTASYNLLLRAVYNSRNHLDDPVRESETIMREILERGHSFIKNDGNVINITNMEEMEESHVIPNIKSYNALIQSYGTITISHIDYDNDSNKIIKDLPGNVKKVEEIIQSLLMGEDILGYPTLSHIKPDIVTINSYLNILAKSNYENAGKRAQNVFDQLTDYSIASIFDDKLKSLQLQADVITYNSVINAWSQSGNADNAVSMLRRLLLASKKSDSLIPSYISFSTTLHSLAKNNATPDCGLKAEEILLEMYDKTHHDSLRPSESCHVGVVKAWINDAKNNNDGTKYLDAEAALLRMRDEGFQPNTQLYNDVLSVASEYCIEHQNIKLQIANQARNLLSLMVEDAKKHRRKQQLHPDVYSFNNVIKANIDFQGAAKRDGFFAAIDIFNSLSQSDLCNANDQTFIQMFKVLQTSIMEQEVEEHTVLCEELFRNCCEAGLLTNAVLRIIENILPKSSIKRLEACRTNKESTDDRLTVYNLPSDWSRNRRKGQNQKRNRKRYTKR